MTKAIAEPGTERERGMLGWQLTLAMSLSLTISIPFLCLRFFNWKLGVGGNSAVLPEGEYMGVLFLGTGSVQTCLCSVDPTESAVLHLVGNFQKTVCEEEEQDDAFCWAPRVSM